MNTARLYANLGRGMSPRTRGRRWAMMHGQPISLVNVQPTYLFTEVTGRANGRTAAHAGRVR